MKKKCIKIRTSPNGRKFICVDSDEAAIILNYINQDNRHKRKFMYITDIILNNLRNPEVYDKEDIDGNCKDVYAMKFFKGQENDRIYCKQQTLENGIFVVITSRLVLKKKKTKLTNEQKQIIRTIATYNYELEEG